MQFMPFLWGVTALVITVLLFSKIAFGASLFGFIISAIVSHGVGTAVALALDAPRAALRRIAVALLIVVVFYVAIIAMYGVLIYTAPQFVIPYVLQTTALTVVLASVLCVLIAHRVEPAWLRYAAPLAIVTIAISASFFVRVYNASADDKPAGFSRGSRNVPEAPIPP